MISAVLARIAQQLAYLVDRFFSITSASRTNQLDERGRSRAVIFASVLTVSQTYNDYQTSNCCSTPHREQTSQICSPPRAHEHGDGMAIDHHVDATWRMARDVIVGHNMASQSEHRAVQVAWAMKSNRTGPYGAVSAYLTISVLQHGRIGNPTN
nr:hypothetical protein CFP56_12248 [Quercus suber]